MPIIPISSTILAKIKSFCTSGNDPSLYSPLPIPFPHNPPEAIAFNELLTCQLIPVGSISGKRKPVNRLIRYGSINKNMIAGIPIAMMKSNIQRNKIPTTINIANAMPTYNNVVE